VRNSVTKAILGKCDDVSQVLKSLSHPVRLKVLCQVIDEERSVNELTEFCGISQSAMSQFLNRMRAEGIVNSRREGTHVYYGIGDPKLVKLLRAIKEIYC
jgi:ArsR family transcriptional regulator, virulence genes transcriptional regulator